MGKTAKEAQRERERIAKAKASPKKAIANMMRNRRRQLLRCAHPTEWFPKREPGMSTARYVALFERNAGLIPTTKEKLE